MMHAIVAKHAGEGAFQPEEIAILVAAFDSCWQRLQKSGARYGSDRSMQAARERLGKGIIEAARRGERDPHRLCEDAILQMAKADRRGAP
jgi:hypothetical protein